MHAPGCLPEFAQCGNDAAAQSCWPHVCFRQSPFYAQCGRACPAHGGWECSAAQSTALIMARWGEWPAWLPIVTRTLAANPSTTFLLVGDRAPQQQLPSNARHVPCTLEQLRERARQRLGATRIAKLDGASVAGRLANRASAAKTNDLKPMFGELFSDELAPFSWWGYLQEDALLGSLDRLWPPHVLATADVVCPFGRNASGVLMLFRNTPSINSLWRRSAAAARVLADPRYLIFDEWWGGHLSHDDHLAGVLGREASEGRLRLASGGSAHSGAATAASTTAATTATAPASGGPLVAGDKRVVGGQRQLAVDENIVACWRRGELWVPGDGGPGEPPCVAAQTEATGAGGDDDPSRSMARPVGLLHLSLLKREMAGLRLSDEGVLTALRQADEFVVTRHGLWMPLPATAEPSQPVDAAEYLLASVAGLTMRIAASALHALVRGLHARRMALRRCNRKVERCPAAGTAVLPRGRVAEDADFCALSCSSAARTGGHCTSHELRALGVMLCGSSRRGGG